MIGLPEHVDPREIALKLAVITERLDERSLQAVQQVEAASALLQREARTAALALADERRAIAAHAHTAAEQRKRYGFLASAALLTGAVVAMLGAAFALDSARRELASLERDVALLHAINAADLVLCAERICAVFEDNPPGTYQLVARRTMDKEVKQ